MTSPAPLLSLRVRRALVWVAALVLALLGASAGAFLAASAPVSVGPFDAVASVRPSFSGDSVVEVPPLGELALDSHSAPVEFRLRLVSLRPSEAEALVQDPTVLDGLGRTLARDLRSAAQVVVVRALVGAFLGGLLVALLVTRRWRRLVVVSGLSLTVAAASLGAAFFTFRPGSLAEPRYSGLLASAPSLVGSVSDITRRFGAYRVQLERLARNVGELYATTSTLTAFEPDEGTIRVLVVSDLHLNPAGMDAARELVRQYEVDFVLDAGDLTDRGTAFENRFANRIAELEVPYVYVRGNHDTPSTEDAVRAQPNAHVLAVGDSVLLEGVRIVGGPDPTFTPDKSLVRDDDDDRLRALGEALVPEATYLGADIALVHEPLSADPLVGHVPLVVSGHTHQRSVSVEDGTTRFVEGSSGGAGLRNLDGEFPLPLTFSVLYLDRDTQRLEAWDDVTLGGLGERSASIERHLALDPARPDEVDEAAGTGAPPAELAPTPAPAGSTPAPVPPPPPPSVS